MKYRKFGSLEWEVSILGLGTQRLPCQKAFEAARLHASESIEIIRHAIDHGANYLDLGYPHDLNRQERLLSTIHDALQDGYSQKIRTSVTLPSHLIHSSKDFDLYLDTQLAWLQMARTDFCLFGRLNRENWPILQAHGAVAWADQAMKDGRFDGIGISFHDHFQPLKTILAAYDRWALCQFQFSYMDVDHDPGASGIQYAAQKGLAVVVTEPLRCGRLAGKPPAEVARIWAEAGPLNRLADWGLRFVWNYAEVAVVVCDLESLYELAEAERVADGVRQDSLTVQEEILIARARDAYRKRKRIPCNSCRPCMPCPEGIDVPRVFEIYNDAFVYDDAETARSIYRSELHQVERCTQCRYCEDRCVKKLPILEWLDEARRLLTN